MKQKRLRVSSRQIAEVTGKKHSHVKSDIRSCIKLDRTQNGYLISKEKDSYRRDIETYRLTIECCIVLADRYKGKAGDAVLSLWSDFDLYKFGKGSLNETQYKAIVAEREQYIDDFLDRVFGLK